MVKSDIRVFRFNFLSFLLLFVAILVYSCKSGDSGHLKPASYDPPGSTDTRSKPIEYQVKKIFRLENGKISVSNEFPGARLNNFLQLNDTLFSAIITPENAPINRSPWYAFKIWSEEPRDIDIQMEYVDGSHRYFPEYSYDDITWQTFDSANVKIDTIRNITTLSLQVSPDTLTIAAQELITSRDAARWAENMSAKYPFITREIIGYSNLGKPLYALKIGNDESNKLVAVIGRQHPPEITGYLAMQAFIEALTGKDSIAQAFRKNFLVGVVPMVNPDGSDQGHWRHNIGGVDLNRDWVNFHQPETRAVKQYYESLMEHQDREMIFEIDFHSTSVDLFYVFPADKPSNFTGLTHRWLDSLDANVPDYSARRITSDGNSPVSTYHFYQTYNAEAVTYEVGDNTPRERISEISEIAADALMKILLEKYN